MATYAELSDINNSGALLERMTAACAIQAEVIRNENVNTSNHANRVLWAKAAFSDPRRKATEMMWAILAQNASVTKANILAASDSTVLTAVAACVDIFANGS